MPLLTNQQSRLLGGGRVPWYRADGAPMPVAAYQPKGAASLAASYINLANPGTYNAAPGTAPGWSAANGWAFTTTQWLTTGIVAQNGWSLLLLCTATGSGSGGAGRALADGDNIFFGVVPWVGTNCWIYNGTLLLIPQSVGATPTVLGFAGKGAYINGVSVGTIGAGNVSAAPLLIGNNASVNRGMAGTIRAVAIYNAVLTPAQVAAVSSAMSQL